MCGIIGYINPSEKFDTRLADVIPDLLAVDTLRGKDSTGLVKVNSNHQTDWVKVAIPGWEFLKHPDVIPFLRNIDNQSFVIGHNRMRTHGANTNDDAHPFEHEHIVMVHNGTVSKLSALSPDNNHGRVDSDMICESLAKNGVQETVNNLHGAYSLVWYDKIEKKLKLLRNHERPMSLTYTKEGPIVFASEARMAMWIAGRRGFEVEKVDQTTIDMLYTFDHGSGIAEKIPMSPKRSYTFFDKREAVSGGETKKPYVSPGTSTNLVSLTERARLKSRSKHYLVGGVIYFSVNDFDTEKSQGGFVRVEGDIPSDKDVMCEGNYSGDIEFLFSSKNLMQGTIASIGIGKKVSKIMLMLKNLKDSGIPDPYFDKPTKIETPSPKQETAEELDAKLRKAAIERDKSSAVERQRVAELARTKNVKHLKEVKMSKTCTDCGHVYDRAKDDAPYLVLMDAERNATKLVCKDCFDKKYNPEKMFKKSAITTAITNVKVIH